MGCSSSSAADDRLNFVASVRLFKRLPEGDRAELVKNLKEVSFDAGSTIIKQGDEGQEFYVIKSGECTVLKDGAKIATLKTYDHFGETALLREEPRTATITAAGKVETLTISREKFQELGLHEKLEFPKRGAVVGAATGQVERQAPSQKTAEEKQLMAEALKKNKTLTEVVNMDEARVNQMIAVMWRQSVKSGTEIIKQGDLNADYFYIVIGGEFELQISQGQSAETVSETAVLTPGSSFGELALLYFAPRAATIIAKTDSTVMVIDRMQFKQIMMEASLEQQKAYVEYLDKIDIFAPLKDKEKTELARALNEVSFDRGDCIFQQGEAGDKFYILVEGKVEVVTDGKKVAELVATDKEKQFFGEKALLTNEPRMATINVTSETARTLYVDRDGFGMVLGPLEQLKQRGKSGTTPVKKVEVTTDTKRFGNIVRKDLKRLGLLGCGGFGTVELVEHTKTGETYALKSLSKGYIVKSGMQNSVMSEKAVQIMCDSPFIVKLYETYNGDQSLYLLLELALGGELYATYTKKSLWGREDCAKFYVAGTTFAFEHLHSKKIIFRDLKPENLLLNDQGQIKLTDMGLAKVVVGKTYTTCGTPDYFAPELIASKGHTVAVDWWTLGILTFELLSGHPPFESATPMQIYQKVTKGINRVNFPRKCKGPAEQLIKGLCHHNPSERLPMKKGEVKNIKEHSWYQGFDWNAMQTLEMTPPYKPTVRSKKDLANFSAKTEDKPPQIQYKDDKSGWDKDFATST